MPIERKAARAAVWAAVLFAVSLSGMGGACAERSDAELAQRLAEEGRRAHDPYLLVAAAEILAQDRPHADERLLEAYLNDAADLSFDDSRIAAEIAKIRPGMKK